MPKTKQQKNRKPPMKKTALIRLSNVTLFITFDDETITGTITKADGTTQLFSDSLKEVK